MTQLSLPEKAGYALRNAPKEQQDKILAIFAQWPSNVGQSTPAYSKALHQAVGQVIRAWGGVWLNPEEGTRHPKLQCAKGHVWHSRPFLLSRGIWCSGCYVDSLRDSLETMHRLAAKHGGKCLSQAYVNTYTKLKWQCAQSHIWEATPDVIKKGKWCPQCAEHERKNRYLLEIQEYARERGGECLSEQYLGNKNKIAFRCAHGHTWQTAPKNIRSAQVWCPVCRYDRRRRSLADLQALAAAGGGKCLATEYVSMNDKVQWQCARGHVWKAAGCRVQLGTWCPQCAHLALCKHEKSRRKYLPDRREI